MHARTQYTATHTRTDTNGLDDDGLAVAVPATELVAPALAMDSVGGVVSVPVLEAGTWVLLLSTHTADTL